MKRDYHDDRAWVKVEPATATRLACCRPILKQFPSGRYWSHEWACDGPRKGQKLLRAELIEIGELRCAFVPERPAVSPDCDGLALCTPCAEQADADHGRRRSV